MVNVNTRFLKPDICKYQIYNITGNKVYIEWIKLDFSYLGAA